MNAGNAILVPLLLKIADIAFFFTSPKANIIPDSNTEPIPISVNYFAPQDEMENIANYAIPAGASDPVPIDRFAENLDTWQVVFHEMLFGNTFDSSRGEYRYTFVMTATLISPTK